MKNRIDQLFEEKKQDILSVYFTAGFPALEDTRRLLRLLRDKGADLIEIGIPFSDPLADGPVIQQSGGRALANGMTLELLFRQLEGLRSETEIPVVLMGYLNTVLRFGMEKFCRSCRDTGIDGVILPDLPPELYETQYRGLFESYGIHVIFLITPHTPEARIRKMDGLTRGFLYLVSSAATTGGRKDFTAEQTGAFARIAAMQLQHPLLIGFGVHDAATFRSACAHAAGAIVGSAFIRCLEEKNNPEEAVDFFFQQINTPQYDHPVA